MSIYLIASQNKIYEILNAASYSLVELWDQYGKAASLIML